MILLTTDEVLLLHEKLTAATGGSPELRDMGLLESAVQSVDAGFGDVERYPTIEEKAARLAYALVSNHAFVDGNKRVGVLAMLVTLRLNGIELRYSQQELIALGLGLAKGKLLTEDVVEWIARHGSK